MDVDENNKLLLIKGSVPGKRNSIVFIKDSVKKRVKKWKNKLLI